MSLRALRRRRIATLFTVWSLRTRIAHARISCSVDRFHLNSVRAGPRFVFPRETARSTAWFGEGVIVALGSGVISTSTSAVRVGVTAEITEDVGAGAGWAVRSQMDRLSQRVWVLARA